MSEEWYFFPGFAERKKVRQGKGGAALITMAGLGNGWKACVKLMKDPSVNADKKAVSHVNTDGSFTASSVLFRFRL